MDRVVPRSLHFDRFALDLRRGSLRAGDQEIELRPKAFEVLRYLVENAGRLIAHEELHEAVWGDVAVSNDSIVQCIRELRSKLSDNDHCLIKTVARRGYVLDAVVTEHDALSPPNGVASTPSNEPSPKAGGVPRPASALPQPRVWLAVIAVLLVGAGSWAIRQPVWPISSAHPGQAQPGENALSGAQTRATFRDCADCPDVVTLPAGDFMMGSPASEFGHQDVEGLPRRVVIRKRFAVGKFKVTVDQFARFVAETNATVNNQCRVIVAFNRDEPVWDAAEVSFRHPGFDTAGSHPVVCVSWYEAQAYVNWLQRRTGRPYRLLTESEWEYAARAGTSTRYSFGNDETKLCAYARFADLGSRFGWHDACRSEAAAYGTSPVGRLRPNQWGIFDMHGNAWEWVQDCWTPNAAEIPTDGSAFMRPHGCEEAVIRGGSFASGSRRVRSATRARAPTARHNYNNGFRVALSLGD